MITTSDVLEIAQLTRIHVEESELDALASELNELAEIAEQIADIDAEPVPLNGGVGLDALREDTALPSPPRNSMLSEGEYFTVVGGLARG